ncbi:MAG: hypothetical protein ACRDOY_04295 [Nocardioidaceae bacterium]
MADASNASDTRTPPAARIRTDTIPAAVIAAAVVAFVAYSSLEGSSRAVDFAVTGAQARIVPADSSRVPARWEHRAPSARMLLVNVSWAAVDDIGGGSYVVLVTTPRGWVHLGCRPECEWSDDEPVRNYARSLPLATYRLGAAFSAEQTGRVRLGFRLPRGAPHAGRSFVPTAWLVQTDGDDVLGAEQIPLS